MTKNQLHLRIPSINRTPNQLLRISYIQPFLITNNPFNSYELKGLSFNNRPVRQACQIAAAAPIAVPSLRFPSVYVQSNRSEDRASGDGYNGDPSHDFGTKPQASPRPYSRPSSRCRFPESEAHTNNELDRRFRRLPPSASISPVPLD